MKIMIYLNTYIKIWLIDFYNKDEISEYNSLIFETIKVQDSK